MTVNELIEQLKGYPGDMVVLTLGCGGRRSRSCPAPAPLSGNS